ncbi:GGDEF domain-containing protein [Lachnotalea glycerini]|uniref:GGDEF domain-containing protein n=1 Tax=Lachnotalea glycerini TaxID=1763509 RepID=A0A371J6J2_9FIRM|nr:GGDEF domain-containing protein [Lachnotalea glycerini]RDY28288.1 GGDEF domain-containing protein [Lachnotalea glycerini]
MELFQRIDINLIALVVLGTIRKLADIRLEKNDSINRYYIKIVEIIMLQLIFETTSCVINRRMELWLIPISYLLHIALFCTGVILTFHAYMLIYKLIIPNQSFSRNIKIILQIPMFICILLVLLSPIYHFIYYIDSNNVYHRGNYFIIYVTVTYFYILLILILVILYRRNLGESEFSLFLIFGSFPILGGIIQSIFYGTLLMWSSTAFALVVLYSYLQQRMVHLDYLTGVWSRGSFEFYIKNRLLQKDIDKIGVIYCDIDGLKGINDNYGHLEGDAAIKGVTQIIKNVIRKTDIIVRMGGDEFIVVLECEDSQILTVTLERIEKAFEQYNVASDKRYKLSCSFGSDILNTNFKDIEQFLHHVDSLMYANKKSKRERNS